MTLASLALIASACTGSAYDPDLDGDATEPATTPPSVSSNPANTPASTARLATLSVTGGTLSPSFSATQLAYNAPTGELTVAATAADDGTVDFELRTLEEHAVTSDLSSPWSGSLSSGHQLVAMVTSADGTATAEYPLVGLPGDFPTVTATVHGQPSPGWIWLGNVGEVPGKASYALAVDETGVVRWYEHTAGPPFDVRVQDDGTLSWIGGYEDQHGALLFDDQLNLSHTYHPPTTTASGTPVGLDVHEFKVLPTGNVLLLGLANRTVDMTPWGGKPDTTVIDNVLYELDADGDVVFEWDSADHMPFDELPSYLLEGLAYADVWEYAHINSIDVDPDDGHYVMSVRFTSEVYKVAKTATTLNGEQFEPGDIVWRLGGEQSDFDLSSDPRTDWDGFSLQHSARPLPGGRIMVFDNSLRWSWTTTGDARYVEYTLDTATMTATLYDDWELGGAGGVDCCGSVQRTSDGHTVIGWGDLDMSKPGSPVATEISETGERLLDIYLPGFMSYRAWKSGPGVALPFGSD